MKLNLFAISDKKDDKLFNQYEENCGIFLRFLKALAFKKNFEESMKNVMIYANVNLNNSLQIESHYHCLLSSLSRVIKQAPIAYRDAFYRVSELEKLS